MRFRKIGSCAIVFVMLTTLVGCASTNQIELEENQVNVVTSFYPLYDFAQKIGGDYVHVVNLVPAGVEPHEWSPKSGVMRKMTQADLLIYHGVGLESWIDDFLHSRKADSSLVVVEASNGVELIPAKESEHADEADHHDEASHADETEHNHGAYDPHTWLSPRNAIVLAKNIRDGLIQVDPVHRSAYETNYEQLALQLTQLDQKFRTALTSLEKKEIAVSHEAFNYLCKEYGLTQIAIMGLSPDAEPTAQKIKEVNNFIQAHELKYIFFEELVSDKLAKTLANDLGIQTLVLNPLEGLTEAQQAAGMDYISVMEQNLKHLVQALSS